MTSPTDDIDPLDATTVAEFAEFLRKVRTRAGSPSYRTLQQWGERNNIPLPRSTVQNALAGRRLPRKTLVLALVRAFGIPASDHRWEIAWTRLADQASKPAPPRGQLQHSLARDVEAAGLLRIGAGYLSELEWKQLFAEVTELDIVVAYGQTWRNLHARELAQVAARPGRRIRVFLADPHNEFTVALLADRFDITTTNCEPASPPPVATTRPSAVPAAPRSMSTTERVIVSSASTGSMTSPSWASTVTPASVVPQYRCSSVRGLVSSTSSSTTNSPSSSTRAGWHDLT